jgi:hypothetical protein
MNAKSNTTSGINAASAQFRRRIVQAPVPLLVLLALALPATGRTETPPPAIPVSDIGARATAGYQGDALGVTAAADGARLRCGFQKLEGHATAQGLWLESTKPGAAGTRPRTASAIYRAGPSTLNPSSLQAPFPLEDKVVRFTRPRLTEEYSVSVDGLRQDFINESLKPRSGRSARSRRRDW